MTPGQVGFEAYNDGMEAGGRAWPRGTYGTPYMIKREVSSWELAAAAVIADSAVAWEAAMAALTAENDEMRVEIKVCREDNDLLRAELNSHVGKQGLKEMLWQMTGHAHANETLVSENDRLRAASSLALTKVQREAIMAVIRNAQSSGIAFAYQKERKYPEYSVLRAIAEIETILEGNDDQVDGS